MVPISLKEFAEPQLEALSFGEILRLLNYYSDPTEAVYAAAKGDSSRIDMSVGDIYGGGYSGIGLAEKYIASSFGKLKDL
jgi:pantothenate kinase